MSSKMHAAFKKTCPSSLLRLAALFVLAASAAPTPRVQATGLAAASVQVVGAEVRLRKLHLVRPDLIPYPIAYEVVC